MPSFRSNTIRIIIKARVHSRIDKGVKLCFQYETIECIVLSTFLTVLTYFSILKNFIKLGLLTKLVRSADLLLQPYLHFYPC